jgi:hypothetical protein
MGNFPSTLSVSPNLPTGWDYQGCWTDYGLRKLAGLSYVDSVNMTEENCIDFCNTRNYTYAGVEYGQECYCGYLIGAGSAQAENSECSFACPGATDQPCGAGYRLSVFHNTLGNAPVVNPGPPDARSLGCYIDSVYNRSLPVFQASKDGMTVSDCTSSCRLAGYSLAGLEYSRECFCGDVFAESATSTDEGCDMICAGNSTEFCGGSARMNA